MNKQRFAIPSNLDLEKIIIEKYPEYRSHLYKFYYLVDHLLENRFLNHRYSKLSQPVKNAAKKKMIPLNSQILKKMLGDAYYRKILDILLVEDIIMTDNQYVVNNKSKEYFLTAKYINTEFHYILCTNPILLKKIEKRKLKLITNLSPLQNEIREMLTTISFDCAAAYRQYDIDKNILPISKLNSLKMHLNKIESKDYFFAVDNYSGRIFHNYDNLKKEYRQFIVDDNSNPMIEIDIANSQPFFLSLILKELAKDFEPFPDIEFYFDLTHSATFYDFVISKDHKITKDNILTFMYCPIQKEDRIIRDIFIEHFPTVYELMKTVKLDNYRDLPNDLQKVEADMMINTVAPILLAKNIQFVPIHDSVMISVKYKNEVVKIIEDEFKKKYNLVPKLRVK